MPHPRVGAARADRQLQPGRRLGDLGGVPPARAARPDHVRPDDRRLVDLHRHPGHPAGHLRDLRRRRRQALRRHAGRHDHADRRPRRHGRRAAARRHHERRRRDLRRRATSPGSRRRIEHRYLDEQADSLDDAVAARSRPRDERRPLSIGLLGNAADVCPGAARAAARRSTSSPTRPRPTTRCPTCPIGVAFEDWPTLRGRGPGGLHRAAPASRWPRTCEAMVEFQDAGRRGLRLRQLDPRRGRKLAATTGPSTSPASCRPTSGRCSARARARSAGPRCPATRRTSPPPTRRSSSCSRRTSRCAAGSRWPASGSHFQGLPARICWLGYGERHQAGLRFNEMVASGELSGARS